MRLWRGGRARAARAAPRSRRQGRPTGLRRRRRSSIGTDDSSTTLSASALLLSCHALTCHYVGTCSAHAICHCEHALTTLSGCHQIEPKLSLHSAHRLQLLGGAVGSANQPFAATTAANTMQLGDDFAPFNQLAPAAGWCQHVTSHPIASLCSVCQQHAFNKA